MTSAEPLLLIGASVRAAAESAQHGGYAPIAVDQFNDLDLLTIADARRLSSRFIELVAICQSLPSCDWLYTGGWENRTTWVRRLSGQRRLLGNSPAVLRRVRDPWLLANVVRELGFQFPELRRQPPPGGDGDWLVKSRRSTGGLAVRRHCGANGNLDPAAGIPPSLGAGWYWQRLVHGQAVSAVFLANRQCAALLGTTRQLTIDTGPGSPFTYAGNIGPLPLDAASIRAWEQLGNGLAAAFQLSGVFGVDAIAHEQGVWVLEVNPRYPASAELIELAADSSIVAGHVAACREQTLPSGPLPQHGVFGKRIFFARQALVRRIDISFARRPLAAAGDWRLADISPADTVHHPGAPVVTLLVRHATADAAQQLIADLRGRLPELADLA